MNDNYDVIVIGSGIGSLTAASLLSQKFKKKVLVLEQHFKLGGFTHIFKRVGEHGTYFWDVGLHYVGDMSPGKMPRAIFDYFTNGNVEWNEMPDVYDKFVFPDLTFSCRKGKENLIEDLKNAFPNETQGIDKYFADLKKFSKWYGKKMIFGLLPETISPLTELLQGSSKESFLTTKEYLDTIFTDEKIKAVLTAQWGDYGLPPSQSSLIIHMLIQSHYFDGGYYPKGGSKKIADSVVPIVEAAGGKLLINHEVTEIIIKDGKAIGVRANQKVGNLKMPVEFYSDKVISGAGAYNTYIKMVNHESVKNIREEIENIELPSTSITLYLGLKESPEKLGFNGENHWIYSGWNFEKIYHNRNELLNGKVGMAYLSFPSLKDGTKPNYSAEIITFADYDVFEKWNNKPWKNRSDEYDRLKKQISESLIDFVDIKYPGFKDLVDYSELSTPLTNEHFTLQPKGSIYGLPATPSKFEAEWNSPRTPIKNLYLTGSDSGVHGIVGAMMSGVITAGLAFGGARKIFSLFKNAFQYSKTLEDKRVNERSTS
ncbi:MAG: NAD(P)/FAD-dependent oxidoreductase [Melioribacteraceae bacterium]|nr:NAD(P)/FAD-dependent oxidoreductase [Melioribacteraceae bacterium]MCF8264684.1 NAD(P)/FAD-dependent oxidoreductase [Melioribacteraceae bacterium]MCF8432563.1 NAD(P)/FAD-dependent oxidoreductase [Melioribacteraceae bacterium]